MLTVFALVPVGDVPEVFDELRATCPAVLYPMIRTLEEGQL